MFLCSYGHISSFLPQISCIERTVQTLNIFLPPRMSEMHKHAVSAGLWVAKRERSQAVTGNIYFFYVLIHDLPLTSSKQSLILYCTPTVVRASCEWWERWPSHSRNLQCIVETRQTGVIKRYYFMLQEK